MLGRDRELRKRASAALAPAEPAVATAAPFSRWARKNRGGVSMSDRAGLGDLAQCMVDSDASAKTRAKRSRGKALAASIGLEALVLGAVILWPLVTLGVLQPQQIVTPLPPFRGAHEAAPISHLQPHTMVDSSPRFPKPLYQPPRIPPHIDTSGGLVPPGLDGPLGPPPPGIGEGV